MGSSPIVFSRERNFRELITDTVSFVFQELIPFFKYLALFTGPVLVLSLILPYFFVEDSEYGFLNMRSDLPWLNYIIYFVNVTYVSVYTISYIDAYKKGDEITTANIGYLIIWHLHRLMYIIFCYAAFTGIMIFVHTFEIEEKQLSSFTWLSYATVFTFIFFTLKYSLVVPMLSSTSSDFGDVLKLSAQLIKGRVFIALTGFLILGFISYIFRASNNYFFQLISYNTQVMITEFTDNLWQILMKIPTFITLITFTIFANVFNSMHYSHLGNRLVFDNNLVESTAGSETDE